MPATLIFRKTMLLVAVATLLLTAGCDDQGVAGSDETNGNVARLTYWSSQNPQERRLATQLVHEWNAAHPGVQVQLQPLPAGQSSEEVLLAAIVAGTTPDICSNIWPGIVGSFVEADGVVALDQFAGFDSLMQSRVPPSVRRNFRSADGHVYQIPWKTNPVMMLYNKTMLREAGLTEPPRTLRAYLAAAKRVARDRDGDGRYDRWMGYRDIRPIWWQRYFDYYPFYIAASGGRTFFHEGHLDVDRAASNTVFSFFQTLYKHDYFPVTTFQGNPFAAGKVATDFTGPWNIAWMRDNAPEGLEYGYAPLPLPESHTGPAYTYGDYKNIAIFSTTEHPREAWRFAKFLVTRRADLKLLEITNQIPLRKNLLTDSTYAAFFGDHPKVVPFAQQAPRTRGVDDVSALQEMLDAVAQQYEAAAVYSVISPQKATEKTVERIRLVHDWSR